MRDGSEDSIYMVYWEYKDIPTHGSLQDTRNGVTDYTEFNLQETPERLAFGRRLISAALECMGDLGVIYELRELGINVTHDT